MNSRNQYNDVESIAAEIARKSHHGQFRLGPDKIPYIVHPAMVATLVKKLEVEDAEVIAAAWLHDLIEDTPIKTEAQFIEVFASYGYTNLPSIQQIYSLVSELSMPENIAWADVRSYQIDKIVTMSSFAKTLKIADQVANYLDATPPEWSAEKIRG